MKKLKTYVSCPISIDRANLRQVVDICKENSRVEYWKIGTTYMSAPLKLADVVVIMLPSNKFKSLRKDLPPGVKSELALARMDGKEIFLAYKAEYDGSYHIYNTIIDRDSITGVAGTVGVFEDLSIDCDYNSGWGEMPVDPIAVGNWGVISSNPCKEINLIVGKPHKKINPIIFRRRK